MNTRIRHFIKSSKSWPKAMWSWCKRCLDEYQPYEKEILISFLFFCAGFITGWMLRSFYEGRADAETIRNAILIIGGLMAFYGLVQATKRQESFSEQVQTFTEQAKTQAEQTKIQIKQADTAETQLFNDRLGRGIELLANSDKLENPDKMYCKAGIRVLEDLANSVDVIEHKKIIANLLHDFIRGRTAIINQDDKNDNSIPDHVDESNDQSDVQLALDVYLGLMCLFDETKPMQNFTNLDLSYLDFSSFKVPGNQKNRAKKIQSIDFTKSIVINCNFSRLKINNCIFAVQQVALCDFSLSSCIRCNFELSNSDQILAFPLSNGAVSFIRCEFVAKKAIFDGADNELRFEECSFYCIRIEIVCSKVLFLGGHFGISTMSEDCKLNIKNTEKVDFFGTDISSVSLGSARSTLSNINALKAIYKAGKISNSFTNLAKDGVDETRAYVKNGSRKYFIKSDAEWSEKVATIQVVEEIRQLKQDEIEESQAQMQAEH